MVPCCFSGVCYPGPAAAHRLVLRGCVLLAERVLSCSVVCTKDDLLPSDKGAVTVYCC